MIYGSTYHNLFDNSQIYAKKIIQGTVFMKYCDQTEQTCQICSGSTDLVFRIDYSKRNYSKHSLSQGIKDLVPFYQCKKCGYLFSSLQLSSGEVDKYYSKGIANCRSEYYANMAEPIDERQLSRIRIVQKILKDYNLNGNLLEIGSGYGHLIGNLSEFKNRVAFEPSIHAVSVSNRLYPDVSFIDSVFIPSLCSDKFDAILIFDVIEHISNPILFIQGCKSILNENGIILIHTAISNSFNFRISGENWEYFRSPEHISIFNLCSFELLFNKVNMSINTINFYSNPKILNNFVTQIKNIIKYLLRNVSNRQFSFELCFDHILLIAKNS